uniref:Reverse transcriptase domain-containing protein n=2 Tax=Cicadellinae TaxID=33370 RepID=A0A1B6LNL1_9HEMI
MFDNELATHNIRRLLLPPTRITADTSTSIDCICTNIPEHDLSATVLHTGLSDHTAQICSLDFCKNAANTQTLRRQMGRRNLDQLKSLLSIKNWDTVYKAEDAESAYNIFEGVLRTALDISCPQKKNKNKTKSKPIHYYDQESAEIKAAYLRALETYETTGRAQDKEYMVNIKKMYDKKLRRLQQNANTQKIMTSDNKSKTIWDIIHSETQAKQLSKTCPKLNIDNAVVDNPIQVAEQLNTFFTQMAEVTLQQNKQQPLNNRLEEDLNLLNRPLVQLFDLTPTTWEEVSQVIHNLKNKSSSGIDEYSAKVVKHCAVELTPPLVSIINKSFYLGQFPTKLKVSKVYPKHKKGPKTDPKNYRPISLISTFSKIIEKIVLKRLMSHLTQQNLITDCQHGFQKGKSTLSAIISLVESIIDSIEEGQFVTALFLDYSKAFDCLGYNLISKKLAALGVTGLENRWFVSYLKGRSQVVEIQHTTSGVTSTFRSCPQPITRGVPQGSVLGPILFILLTNDFPALIQNESTSCIMYADDTTLLLKNDSAEELYSNSIRSLKRAITYSKLNDLAINPDKTTQVHFSRKKVVPASIPNISVANQIKFLGVTLDGRLTWADHVNEICKKISRGVYVVKRIKWIGTLEAAKIAYYALVEPHIRYGLTVWGTSQGNLKRILTLQKKAIRTLANLEPLQTCRHAYRTLGILTAPALYIYEAILHVDQLHLQTHMDIHNYPTRHASRLTLPQHRTALYEKKPSYIGRKFKNLLPQYLCNLTGNKLKHLLREFLLERPVYTIEEFLESANTRTI